MMPDILVGNKDDWLHHYTSNRIGDEQLNVIISTLQKSGLVVVEDDKGSLSWRDFPMAPSELHHQNSNPPWSSLKGKKNDNGGSVNDPAKATTERGIFSPLGQIINAIAETALPGLAPSCKYTEEPYETDSEETDSEETDSEVSESQHRVDGSMQLLVLSTSPAPQSTSRSSDSTSSGIPTSDVAVIVEFKLSNAAAHACDNRWEVLNSACHHMHSDCRRKHIYGITIEDKDVALWYFSRSHTSKSHAFDLLDVRAVVRALSSLIFSTVEELGYDADIKRIKDTDGEDSDNPRYVYRVGDRFYKTLKCLDEYENLLITGRATRVWEVIEVHSFDSPQALPDAERRVLRDVWLNEGSSTEREIQQEIFRRCDDLVKNYPAADDPRFYGVDETNKEELRRRLTDGSCKELFLTIEEDRRGAKSKAVAPGFVAEPVVFAAEYSNKGDEPRDYNPKQRNFVVYKEVCRALHELDDLYPVTQALLDCVLALQILFMISWIHRDVSSGNILCYNGHGKLGDLEYAKPFDLNVGRRSSDPKSGTPIFMAVEITSGRPIYKKGGDASNDENERDYNAILEKRTTSPGVRHNFQHDLESIFWILFWLAVTHIGGQDYAATANRLFHSKNPNFMFYRHEALCDQEFLVDQLYGLRRDLPKVLKVGLLKMRSMLHSYYMMRKIHYHDMSSYAPLYSHFREILVQISTATPTGTVRLVQPPRPEIPIRSGYGDSHSRTDHLDAEFGDPEDV